MENQTFSENEVPDYALHNNYAIQGFFGPYRWLSNFWPCQIWFEGTLYPSVENAYQASKAIPENRVAFTLFTAAKAKRAGRQCFLSMSDEEKEVFNLLKYDIMYRLQVDKYCSNRDLREKLIDTGKRYLEETNHWKDQFWGVCDGRGSNCLGHIIMNVRMGLQLPLSFLSS